MSPEKLAGKLQQRDSGHHQNARDLPAPRVRLLELTAHEAIVRRSSENVAWYPESRRSSDRVDSGGRNAKTGVMNSPTLIAALLLVFASPSSPPTVPPEALPEAVQAHPSLASPPKWFAQALALWGAPRVPRPDLYDYRYITW